MEQVAANAVRPRNTKSTVVTFASDVSDAFSYEAMPEQSNDKTFVAFTPPTAPGYAVDDSAGKTIVTIIFHAKPGQRRGSARVAVRRPCPGQVFTGRLLPFS